MGVRKVRWIVSALVIFLLPGLVAAEVSVLLHPQDGSVIKIFYLSPRVQAAEEILNGFDLSSADIPVDEVRGGGPPRDGIPALTDPSRDPVEVADRWLAGEDRVIGVSFGGESVAYPIRILNWHEIVNDVVGGRPVLVTFCPLCGTGVVFDARIRGEPRDFGVSGLLFRSDVLLFERRTESLFSQLLMRGVSGPLKGEPLRPVEFTVTSWEAWKEAHPRTQALSLSTGYARDYGTDPYADYHKSRFTMFSVRFQSSGRGAKDWAFLVGAPEHPLLVPEEEAQAWPEGRRRLKNGAILTYHRRDRRLSATDGKGRSLTVIPGYWFAHRAFYPEAPIVD